VHGSATPPSLPPRRPRSRPGKVLLGALVGLILVGGGALAACGSDEPTASVKDEARDDAGDASEPEALVAAIRDAEGTPPETEATGSDLTLGGSPDAATAAAVTRHLEDAGFDLTGVEISVLPVSGLDGSLLVFDITDEAEGLLSSDDGGEAFVKTFLSAPEMTEASVNQLVLTYRGSDEQGSYVATVTIPIAKLEAALASGTNVGDQLRVQIDREGK
jgi:hypothetical protein